jgi:hypothetical protein
MDRALTFSLAATCLTLTGMWCFLLIKFADWALGG